MNDQISTAMERGMKTFSKGWMLAVLLFPRVGMAVDDEWPSCTACFLPLAMMAPLQATPAATWSFKVVEENDLWNAGDKLGLVNSDRDYSHGISFQAYDGWTRLGVASLMHTPDNIRSRDLQRGDYPYSGELLFSYGRDFRAVTNGLTTLTLTGGWSGYYSMAQSEQEFIHHTLGHGANPMGWKWQLGPDALFEASVRHEQRMAEYGRDGRNGLGGQLLLNGEGDLGNIYTRGTVGAEVRAGWRIPQNQNEPIPLTIDNRDQRSEIRDQRWRVWGSFAVEYSDVAWNYYLRGSPWHTDSNLTSLTPERWVTDYIGGIHIQTPWGWFLGYEYDWRTKEFAQEATDHGWGSITIGKGWIF